ncbi:hypothetical protein AJ80_08426 [Polytolypa hystricis UAMH7299]|uniref:Peptidase A1 domain-containing protein n=1 Tax=Polytolypa hystricis (strain UAMH7299) TaxID=1447883 RepID=A0A2B7X7X8_POLH7|nr:hypothetical protein AJ80_08426 [Polytolypa hystricis UAMH7299]
MGVESRIWNTTADCGDKSKRSPELKCEDGTRAACAWLRGGSLDSGKSSSWINSTEDNVYEFRGLEGTKLGISPWGTDMLRLLTDESDSETESNATIDDFPIYSSSVDSIPQNALGLGRNSIFLDMLVKQKKIASRTWSVFWVWQGAEEQQQMEGSFVLGGYDRAKTEGSENATMDFADDVACPSSLLVYIKDITINTPGGKKEGVLGDLGSAMRSCIKPDAELMTFPGAVYERIKKALPGRYLGPSAGFYYWAMSYDKSFNANMTITLISGLSITIPTHQLALPAIGISKTSNEHVRLDDTKTVMIYDDGVSDMPLLGQVFLSAACLHVDNDQRKFTLWEAKPTEEKKLVTVDHTAASQSSCDEDEDEDVKDPLSSAGPDISSSDSDTSLTSGAIAGIAVGASVFAIAICLLAYCFLIRRRKQGQQMECGELEAREAKRQVFHSSPEELDARQGHLVLSEMPAREACAVELPGDTSYRHEYDDDRELGRETRGSTKTG